jgi:hypothetical protein
MAETMPVLPTDRAVNGCGALDFLITFSVTRQSGVQILPAMAESKDVDSFTGRNAITTETQLQEGITNYSSNSHYGSLV